MLDPTIRNPQSAIRNPKVLLFINSFHVGGSERQAVQLARLLHESGAVELFVAALDKSGDLLPEIERLNLPAIREFRLQTFYDWNFVRQARRCAQFIRENKIEIVHTGDFYTNIFGMTAARLANVKGRVAAKRETGEMRSTAQKLIEKQAFKLSHKIVVNAAAVKRFLVAQGIDERKISVVYNGLDLERLKPTQSRAETLREFGLPFDKKIVTIVANLRHRVKNQTMFLNAAKIIKAKYANAAFALAGAGELQGEYESLAAQLEIRNDVYFLGNCPKVADLLDVSTVCALSSTAEGFSNSILEYMAASRPVVATNVGGAAEAIENGANGFLVESNDVEQMAEKILLLLENELLAEKFGKRGREIIIDKFSIAAQLQQTLTLYQQITGK